MLSRIRTALARNHFLRNVLLLLGGTGAAHLLTVLTLPLLTRLYSPEEFGICGVFVALLGVISVAGAWRYEIALPLPENDASAANLLFVALCCTCLTTMAVSLAVLFFGSCIASITRLHEVATYLWWLPLGVALASSAEVLRYWAIRRKAFGRVARTRVEQALGGVSTQLALGWAGAGALGLIVGQVINNGLAGLTLGGRALVEDRGLFKDVSAARMLEAAREFDRFPKFSTGEAFANVAAVQLPLILIAGLATSTEVGYLMLGMRLMQAPVGLIGSSIGQVFFGSAVENHRLGQLDRLTARALANLARLGVGPLVFAGIVSPVVFGLVFGHEWQRAGELVAWMTPWFVLQFLASPVSMVLQVTSNQRRALLLHLAGLLLRLSSVALVGCVSPESVSEAYAVSGLVFYLVYLLVVCRTSGVSLRNLMRACGSATRFIAAWILAGIALRLVL